MCTLTIVPTEEGYIAGMNRDETLTRERANPPRGLDFAGATALYPSEGSGGTWIGCNSQGNLLALLNWNDVARAFYGLARRSRGLLIPELIFADDLTDNRTRFERLDLKEVLPFRLVGAFPRESIIVEWRWDGLQRQESKFAWRKRHWFSSSVSDTLAHRARGRTCEEAEGRSLLEPVAWVRNLHQSHDPAPGPFSICVHREGAASVSYTEVRFSGNSIAMSYRSGSPCLADVFDSEISLPFGAARNCNPLSESRPQGSI